MKRLRWLFFVREEDLAVELENMELKKGMMVDVELVRFVSVGRELTGKARSTSL